VTETPFGRHDGNVEPVGEVHRLEQRHEAFLLDEQDGAEPILRTADRKGCFGQQGSDLALP
jgi:hypothetical protein